MNLLRRISPLFTGKACELGPIDALSDPARTSARQARPSHPETAIAMPAPRSIGLSKAVRPARLLHMVGGKAYATGDDHEETAQRVEQEQKGQAEDEEDIYGSPKDSSEDECETERKTAGVEKNNGSTRNVTAEEFAEVPRSSQTKPPKRQPKRETNVLRMESSRPRSKPQRTELRRPQQGLYQKGKAVKDDTKNKSKQKEDGSEKENGDSGSGNAGYNVVAGVAQNHYDNDFGWEYSRPTKKQKIMSYTRNLHVADNVASQKETTTNNKKSLDSRNASQSSQASNSRTSSAKKQRNKTVYSKKQPSPGLPDDTDSDGDGDQTLSAFPKASSAFFPHPHCP